MTPYAKRIRALLTPAERQVFDRLNTPQKIQDFLDTVPSNFGDTEDTLKSPRRLLKDRRAHCIEGALFAAAALAYHGYRPLLLDMQSADPDDDHTVALFKENGLWGAISKTTHAILRYRDPIYRSVRELAMSYFNEYFLPDGTKTLLTVSKRPFDLRRYDPKEWVTAEADLRELEGELDWAPHAPLVPKKLHTTLRKASAIERKMLDLEETWAKKKRS